MEIKKNDFIEVEFTGKIKDGGIFDSNIEKDIKESKLSLEPKPLVFSIGNNMFLKGIDNFLIGKEEGKEYEIELNPEDAFGNRSQDLVQRVPSKVFSNHKINPVRGEVLNFDGKIGKVLSVSGGRVIVDFNNPLAGKIVIYKLKILRKIEDLNEKVKSLNEFLFRKDFEFEINEKKLIMKVDKKISNFVKMFSEKFSEILGLELDVREIEDTPKEKISNEKS